MTASNGDHRSRVPGGTSPLGWLGHRVARHPWYTLALWVVVLLVCALPAARSGSVLSGAFSNPLPSSDESVQAQNVYAAQFPHEQAAPSSAIVLLEAPGITGAIGKNATLGVTAKLATDPHLRNVTSVESVYSAYSTFLEGQVQMAWSFLGPALSASPSLPQTVNTTATDLWNPVAVYVHQWESTVANQSTSTPESAADGPAYNATLGELASNATELSVLVDFYSGDGGAVVGFNASIVAGCLSTGTVTTCAEAALRTALPPEFTTVFPSSGQRSAAPVVLENLDLGNWSNASAQQAASATVVGEAAGIAPAWILASWNAFLSDPSPSTAAIATWVETQVAQDPIGQLPLPIPTAIYSAFVSASGSATLVVVSFGVSDTYLVNGTSVTFADVTQINADVSQVLGSNPSYAPISSYDTGAAPLDRATSTLVTSALGILLALTVVVLLVIMLLYFRAPAAPGLAFGMIGIALAVSFALIFVVGTLVTRFNAEIESIVLVFLMSIGTDYSVFLLARYREELVRGTSPTTAVETSVRWAGQSITTSGLAVMVVAAALTLSGISFLTQLGICLLLAVGSALLVNLTVLPAVVTLVGPRVFWPNSGERFARYAARRKRNIETHRDPIAWAGRASTRHPLAVIVTILLISIPIVVVAVGVPVSYNFSNPGLPPSNSAQVGYVQLEDEFGDSFTSTSFALVEFSSPVMPGGLPNATEFQDIAGLLATMETTSGVARVTTLVGAGGAPLGTWLNYSTAAPADRLLLNQTLASYVGVDGRTVLFNILTNASGYSASAISVMNDLQGRVQSYDATHPVIDQLYFGGAAPTTKDTRSLVNVATEEMLIGAAIGLILLMLVILGSAFVPLLALGVIGLSILWSWATTYFVVGIVEGETLIFLLPLILLILVLGLGMDYNVLLLTRVKEERILGDRGVQAIKDAVTHAGGVITAAAVILGGAFLLLGFTSPLALLAAIGLGIGFAVLLQAFVVQLFFTPAVLTLGRDWIWTGWKRSP